MDKKTIYKYTIRGEVLGNLWGGGQGSYPIKEIITSTKAAGIAKAQTMLNDNTLDSGMGFESLQAAYLVIEKKTTIFIDGVDYSRDDYEDAIIGKFDSEEQENDTRISFDNRNLI